MKLNDLKVTRSAKVEAMSAVIELANTEKRNISDEEQETWRGLETEVKGLDSQINMAESQDELNRSIAEQADENELNEEKRHLNMPNEIKNKGLETIRGLISTQGSGKFEVSTRARADVADVQADTLFPEISIFGKGAADFSQLGVKVQTGVKGVLRVPYMTPAVGRVVAESGAIANISDHSPDTNDVIMTKVVEKQIFTYEELADLTEGHFNQIVADLKVGIDRQLTKLIYTKMLTATVVTAADALERSDMLALESAVDGNDVAFYMERATFYEGAAVKIDTGSGKFLFTKEGGTMGASDIGTPIHFNSNFADAATTQWVVCAAPGAIVLGLGDYYGYNKFTDAGIEVTLIQMQGIAISNPAMLRKTADLDSSS